MVVAVNSSEHLLLEGKSLLCHMENMKWVKSTMQVMLSQMHAPFICIHINACSYIILCEETNDAVLSQLKYVISR